MKGFCKNVLNVMSIKVVYNTCFSLCSVACFLRTNEKLSGLVPCVVLFPIAHW